MTPDTTPVNTKAQIKENGSKSLRILFLDIETTPNLGWVWGKYEQDVISFEQEWYMLCFTAKWLDSTRVETWALTDFPGYKKDSEDDKELLIKLYELLDQADIVIGQNLDKFDIRKVNARMVINGLTPPSPYKTIDTLKIAKKYFGFTSNKLNDLGVSLGLGEKIETGGFKLWKGCMNGDKDSWKLMKEYNKQDVLLLEKIYNRLKPWMNNHPKITQTVGACCTCGSHKIVKRGFSISKTAKYHRLKCKDCGSWSQARVL